MDHPQFFENLLVNFADGFIVPGPQSGNNFDGSGVITIYDLTREQGQRKIREYFIDKKDGSSCGWEGSIDIETKKISAFNHRKGNELKFPLFV